MLLEGEIARHRRPPDRPADRTPKGGAPLVEHQAFNARGSRRRPRQSGENPQQGGLARAIGPGDRERLAGGDDEARRPKQRNAIDDERQLRGLDCISHITSLAELVLSLIQEESATAATIHAAALSS